MWDRLRPLPGLRGRPWRRWGAAWGGMGGLGPESGRLNGFLVLRVPRRRLWAQADDDLVLPDVPDPDADHLPVGEGHPCAAVRLRRVWIFHPRRFFVDAHMA